MPWADNLALVTFNLLVQYPSDPILLERQTCVLGTPKCVEMLAQLLATYTIWGHIVKLSDIYSVIHSFIHGGRATHLSCIRQ